MTNPNNRWGILLLLEILFMVFLTGFFPEFWHRHIYLALYTLLYFTAVLCLDQNRKKMLWVAALLFTTTAISSIWNIPVVEAISKVLDFGFFTWIVVALISQIARAQTVTRREILEAINGYLLLGIVFTFLIALTVQLDSTAYNFSGGKIKSSDFVYYSFITFSTTGYGDFLPIKPYSKSLSILIAVCGQLYLAVIIALLVGKFSSQSGKNN